MNILEIIINDSIYVEGYSELFSSQSLWLSFRSQVQKLLEGNVNELTKVHDTWSKIQKQSPHLTPMLIDYFLNQTDEYLHNQFYNKIVKQSQQPDKVLVSVHQFYQILCKFINLIQTKDLQRQILQKILSILRILNIKDKMTLHFKGTFAKHCLGIFQQDIIDFQPEIRQFVMGNCQRNCQKHLDIKIIKQQLEIMSQLSIINQYTNQWQLWLNQDLHNFSKFCLNLDEQNEFLSRCLNYARTFHKSFLKKLLTTKNEQFMNKWINKVQDNLYFLCSKQCSSKIFDIVLEFPQSQLILMELKKCIDRSHLLSQFADQLIKNIQKRLLIPGVITQSILNQYINMLKVLQILDPQGIIFDKITLPIKNYLLKRNDTLRCIISYLTEDGQNYTKLKSDIVKIPSSKENFVEVSSEEDQGAAEKWEILPVKESKKKIRRKYQEIDLVTVLVNLYGSQQAFINEYQNMLAQKLMSAKDYNIDEEIKNIQLLKKRFGESLQVCNIIVKDVKDSKRNDNVIHRESRSNPHAQISLNQMNCLAVSKGYWPINYEATTNFQLPQTFKTVFDQYSAMFSKLKAMRKIIWHYNLGHVNLTLTFDNGTFEFRCLPIHAILITQFDQDKIKFKPNGLSSEQLSNELQIAHHIIKQKMSFWVHKQVVKQIRMPKTGLSLKRMVSMQDGQVIYYKPVSIYIGTGRDDIDEDPDNLIVKQSTSMESHLKHIIQGLIISILNINGPKSPQKIHLLLKTVYKTDLDYTYGQAQTVQILKKMVQRKKIVFNGQTYATKPQHG